MSGKPWWQLFVRAPTKASSDRHIAPIFMPNTFAHRSSDMDAPGITGVFDHFVDFGVYTIIDQEFEPWHHASSKTRIQVTDLPPACHHPFMVHRGSPNAFAMAFTQLVQCIRWLSHISDASYRCIIIPNSSLIPDLNEKESPHQDRHPFQLVEYLQIRPSPSPINVSELPIPYMPDPFLCDFEIFRGPAA